MKKKRILFVLFRRAVSRISWLVILLLLLSSVNTFAQNRLVKGLVQDENGIFIPGVSVVLKGTSTGVNTDVDGNYSISISGNDVLAFSFIGYVSQEIAVQGRTVIDVVLLLESKLLEEVVVVGYGTQSKRNITGAIVDVKGEIIQKSPSISVTNSFAGRLPGVVALNRSGEPGNDIAQLLIRGRSTLGSTGPLIVIDGVAEREGLNQIDPRDIESVSVLKDASAAIYGSRAANGVIIITTKRGMMGKPTVNYTFNQGINQPTRIPDYADAVTLAEFTNEQLVAQGQLPKYSAEVIEKFRNGTDPMNYPNTDWIKSTLKDFSTQSQNNLSIKGGTDAFKYYVSGSYSNQEGIFKNGITNSKSKGVRVNTDSYITENIKVSLDISTQEQNNKYPVGSANSTATSSIVESMYRNFPFLVDIYPNGLYGTGFVDNANPLAMAAGEAGYRDSKIYLNQIKTSFNINVAQVEGLGLDGFIAYDKTQNKSKTFQKPYLTYIYLAATDTYKANIAGGISSPQLTEQYNFSSILILNAKIKYDRTLGDHRINSFVAIEQTTNKSDYFSAFRKNYLAAEIDQLFAGGSAEQVTAGSASEFARRNFFGRLGYGYKGKYLVDFSLRYDGSSAFPKDKRWGLFPGVSVGWILSDEEFFKKSFGFINNLKIRGSWGKMGNDAIAAFQYLANYTFTTGALFGQPNLLVTGLSQSVEPNPNITWEVANTTNIGLDAQLWSGLFSITFDAFESRRTNILTRRNASIPVFTGLNLPLENIGTVENKGFELALTHSKRTGNFNYSIGGNIAYARNTIIDIDEPTNITEWQLQTGHSMGTGLYYITKGIYRTQEDIDASPRPAGTRIGDLQYEDTNSDGIIDSKDRVRLDKTNTPEITFGVNAALGYKNFDLNIFLQGQGNAWQYYFIPQGLFGNVLTEMVNNRPTPDNPNSKYPNLAYDESQVSALQSDFWLRNTNYIRLKNVELGYELPKNVVEKIGIKGLRFYINGFNLLTIDKLKWFDPEGATSRGANIPQNKIYNFGFNITL